MKIKLLYSIATMLLLSCTKNPSKNDFIDISASISYLNSSNNDLLDTTNSISYNLNNMKHFYLNNSNHLIEINQTNLDNPKQLEIHKNTNTGKYELGITPYINSLNTGLDTVISILYLNNIDNDTIAFEINNLDNNIQTKRIWYNGILKYSNSGEKRFAIYK